MSGEHIMIMAFFFPSDFEGTAHGDKKKKDRPKTKRKKTHEHERKMPRLNIINIEQDGEVVECQMETAKHSAVTFKFNCEDDKPSEIAENLVNYHLGILFN